MATPDQRLKLLEMTKPTASLPDMVKWLAMANELEAWIDAGHGLEPPARQATLPLSNQDRGPRPSPSPAARK